MAVVDGHIRCSTCRAAKPIDLFKASTVKAGAGNCRVCATAQSRDWQKRNRAKANAALKARRTIAANKVRAAQLQRKYNLARYGLTVAIYDAILESQGNRCACCGASGNDDGRRLFVDHDHVTGAVRGLLCTKCNVGIGAMGDEIEGVRRALNYLERAQQSPVVRATPALRINLLQGAN